MKKIEMKKLDELEEQKKLNKETKEAILKRIFDNLIIAIDILLLFIALLLLGKLASKETATLIYQVSSIIFFIFSIGLFERAFKKNDNKLWIHAIEVLVISIVILFTPYNFLARATIGRKLVGIYVCAYYLIKVLVIYFRQRKFYLKEVSDIKEIVKKESKDKINKERIEKVEAKKISDAKKLEKKEKQKSKNKDIKVEEQPRRKRGRPRKTETATQKEIKEKVAELKKENKKTKSETDKKIEESKKEETEKVQEPVKRKRGRPRKTETAETEKKENPKKDDSANIEKEPVKRKRGRPKKEEKA